MAAPEPAGVDPASAWLTARAFVSPMRYAMFNVAQPTTTDESSPSVSLSYSRRRPGMRGCWTGVHLAVYFRRSSGNCPRRKRAPMLLLRSSNPESQISAWGHKPRRQSGPGTTLCPQYLQSRLTMKCEFTFRWGRTRPAHARSSGSETLSRTRSLADCTIGTLESSFQKRQSAEIGIGRNQQSTDPIAHE
jgi:hypothetical protein